MVQTKTFYIVSFTIKKNLTVNELLILLLLILFLALIEKAVSLENLEFYNFGKKKVKFGTMNKIIK